MSSYIKDIFGPTEPISAEPDDVEVMPSDLMDLDPEYIPEPIEDPTQDLDWSDYLDPNEVQDISDIYNLPVGDVRQVSDEACKSVLASAFKKYAHLEELEIRNALEWDLHGFLEYATIGHSESFEFDESYAQYLTSGHPHEGGSSILASALWVSGAPEISESSREILVASVVPNANDYVTMHARTRLFQLVEAGKLSETTISHLSDLTTTN